MTADAYTFRTLIGRIIVDAWNSEAFLASLQKEPRRVLGSYGLQPPPQLSISIHADSAAVEHLIARLEWVSRGGAFMQRLQKEPKAALESIGFGVRDGVEYKVLFNSSQHMNIVIPRKPSRHECSIEKIR